jgi:nucleotide-binding universal stress UspA family protein
MANRKTKTGRFLVVVDESPGSKRALDYAGRALRGRRNVAIILLHLLPPLPPELLEFGGAENPRKEQKLEAELRGDQQAWIRSVRTSAKSFLTSTIQQLHKAGVPRDAIHLAFSHPASDRDAATTVLEHARSKRCHTIVIGHAAHSWFRELAGGDLVEHLLRRSKGLAMWVVQ